MPDTLSLSFKISTLAFRTTILMPSEATLKYVYKWFKWICSGAQWYSQNNLKSGCILWDFVYILQWRHNERDGISNHRHLDCLLNRLFRRISKEISKLHVTGPGEVNSPHKGPITRTIFPFDDVIMNIFHHNINSFVDLCFVAVLLRIHNGFVWSIYP